MEIYDPKAGAFADAGSLAEARGGPRAVLLPDGRVLVSGGTRWEGGQDVLLASVEIYDPATGQSAIVDRLAEPRSLHVAVSLMDGRVLLAGGVRGMNQLALCRVRRVHRREALRGLFRSHRRSVRPPRPIWSREDQEMERHLIPNSPLSVSSLCYGLGAFGSRVKEAEAERLFATFRAAGGNFFDTAHCYAFWDEGGAGCSERALRDCLRRFGGRDEIVIATKGGHPDAGPRYPRPDRYLAPEVLAADIRDSLENLGVETIDLYYLHRDDTRVPVSEIIDALNREVDAGRIRTLGASNWSVERIEAANGEAAACGLRGFVASQPQWSLAEPNWTAGPDPTMRTLTEADQAWYSAHEVAVIPYSSTANGYFATGGERGGDYRNPKNEARLQRVEQVARELNATPNQIALAYLMRQGFLVVPIVGTANFDHLADALGSARVDLTPEQVRWLQEG